MQGWLFFIFAIILEFFCNTIAIAEEPRNFTDKELNVSPATASRFLNIKDYLNWAWVSNPQISPNGEAIIYNRTHVNIQEDRYDSELWIMDSQGADNERLLNKSVSEVAWSPDSKSIAYVAETENGSRELFVRRMDKQGITTQLTFGGKAPSSLSWSTDGKLIAFRSHVSSQPKWNIELPVNLDVSKWAANATVVDKLHYRDDRIGLKPLGYMHIFVVSSDGGTAHQLTKGEWNAGAKLDGQDYGAVLQWSMDNKSIVFSANMQSDADFAVARSSIYRVDVKTETIRQITKIPEFAMRPRVSPNGKLVAYIGANNTTKSNFSDREIHVVGVNGYNGKVLVSNITDGVPTIHWAKNSRGLYYVYGKQGAYNVHYVSLNGEIKNITSGAQSFTLSSVSNDGVAVATHTTANEPGDIVRFDLLASGGKMQRLTAVNEDVLKDIELGRVEEIWYDSTENTRVQGWIIYPPNFDPDKKYPLLLGIHGGPEGMWTGDFHFSTIAFSFQEWAARGYVVLYTNPRGSTGYSGEFSQAIYNAYPGRRDYEDLMHGVDAVINRGFINKERVYVQGCSGGGALTAWVVTQTDRFAGAAALCPIVNWISFAGSTDIPAWAHNHFKKYFWDDASAWLEHSSILHVKDIKTPTLIMVGENDIRTPVAQSQEFYTALRILGVPTKLILLKDEAHATWLFRRGRPSNFLRAQLYLQKWFNEWRRIEGANGAYWNTVENP